MRFSVHYSKDFEGTDYIEIGPGNYDRKHWQEGFVFVWEDDFFVAEDLILKHIKDYDHFATNNIPPDIGPIIVAEWKAAANALKVGKKRADEVLCLMHVNEEIKKDLEENRSQTANMLNELAVSCEGFIQDRAEFCILGL